MTELTAWMQSNWFELGNLLLGLAFLTAGVWFARGFLRTIRSLQEQIGALLKLSISATPEVRHSGTVSSKHSLADASPYWLTPSETQASTLPEPAENNPGRLRVAWHHLVQWLKEPLSGAEMVPLRRALRWLQAPIGG